MTPNRRYRDTMVGSSLSLCRISGYVPELVIASTRIVKLYCVLPYIVSLRKANLVLNIRNLLKVSDQSEMTLGHALHVGPKSIPWWT